MAALLLLAVAAAAAAGGCGPAAAAAAGLAAQWGELAGQDFEYYKHPAVVPSHRYNHAAFADAEGRMVVVHGYMYNHRLHTADWQGDVWRYDPEEAAAATTASNGWARLHDGTVAANQGQPVPRGRYGMCGVIVPASSPWLDGAGQSIYIFGGDDGERKDRESSRLDGLWRFDLASRRWTGLGEFVDRSAAAPAWPAERSLAACALVSETVMLMHGGLNRADTWLYDFAEGLWHDVTAPVSPGKRHGALMVAHHGVAYLFAGGEVQPIALHNDLWQYTLTDGWRQLAASQPVWPITSTRTLPAARSYHSGVYLPAHPAAGRPHDLIVAHGGANCTGSCQCLSDTWVYDLQLGAWQHVPAPSGEPATRYHQTMVLIQDSIVMFGGESYRPRYMYHNGVLALRIGTATGLRATADEALGGVQGQGRVTAQFSLSVLACVSVLLLAALRFCRRRRRSLSHLCVMR